MTELGLKVEFFRTTWGIFNPVTFHCAKINHLKIVLWSIHAMDWSRWVTADYIKNKLIKKVKPGDIILLHDGRGSKNSPLKTIKYGVNYGIYRNISHRNICIPTCRHTFKCSI